MLPASPTPAGAPDLSMIMPCYNEEAIVGYTIPRLFAAFTNAGHRLELIAVDNGSSDRTGEILGNLATIHPGLVKLRVEVNRGYGFGVTSGLPLATARWVGFIPADGQVDAEDVVRLYQAAMASDGNVVAKVRRRFRMDGLKRKVISVSYNLFVRALWPGLGSIDVNGTPKILRRDLMVAMRLTSLDWFLDPELMIKAHRLGLRTIELNVFGRMRSNGLSHIRPQACWDFFRQLLALRLSSRLSRWAREADQAPAVNPGPSVVSQVR
jgi:glycosyltransferase involved in cell wall biosynthesis